MNNYANWKLTQLLPESNPYFEYGKSLVWITEKELDVHLGYSNLAGEMIENHYIRQGWTFEDIRLYLSNKGFNINYKHNLFDDKVSWSVCVNNMINRIFSTENVEQDSYQQAREEAIKYCLTKIKNG